MTVESAIARSISFSGCLRLLKRAVVGSNYRWLKKQIVALKADTSHWKGKAHGTTVTRLYSKTALLEHSTCSTGRIKKIVIRENLIPYVCAECNLKPFWNGKPLVLRLDHKNGIRNDHRHKNLRFLCPNCDAQTDTYCGKNKTQKEKRCPRCGCSSRYSRLCRSCAQILRVNRKTKITWPSQESLKSDIAKTSVCAVARLLGVSDNAVRKHLRSRTQVVEGEGL